MFSQPAHFTLGNVGGYLSDLRTERANNTDLSLFKEFLSPGKPSGAIPGGVPQRVQPGAVQRSEHERHFDQFWSDRLSSEFAASVQFGLKILF